MDVQAEIAHTLGMTRSRAAPILIDDGNIHRPLERIHLGNGIFDESWLQALIQNHPSILPVSEIEPGFGDLVAIAREVPCGHGFIDNLFLTPSGDIVLVETKLWRNSQMRREVVAQALDYVAALGAMTYDAFEAAASRGQGGRQRLYDLIKRHPEALEEAEFIDAVSINLKRGRMLAIVLGDGIRAETEALGSLLQSHAGLHFTFALIEIATWRTAEGDIIAIPSTLGKTVMIERGIVRVEQGNIVVHPIVDEARPHAQSISSGGFWEKMEQRSPTLPAVIRSMLSALEPLGVYADIKRTLNLKADLDNRVKPVSFGYIMKNGQFWTETASRNEPERIWRPYLETLAGLIHGQVTAGVDSHYVTTNGKSAPRIEQFLPQHQDAVLSAIQAMLRTLNDEGG